MNRFTATLLFALGLSFSFISNSFAFSAAYDQIIKVNGKEVTTFKVKLQDKNIRVENNMGGTAMMIIRNDKGTFNYLKDQNIATKMPAELDRPNLADDLPQYKAFLEKNNAKVVGSEKVGTYDTDVYEFVDPTTQMKTKAWLWKEKEFPVKFEVNAPEGLTTVEMSGVVLGETYPTTDFELPADAKINDLSQMAAGPDFAAEAAQTAAPAGQ